MNGSISRKALFVALILTTAAIGQEADEAENAFDQAVQGQIEKLVQQQNDLADRYNAVLAKLKKDEGLAALDKAISETKARLAKAESNNEALVAARVKEQEVRAEVKQAIDRKLREHGEGGQLLKRLEDLQAKRADHLWQVELAKFQMSHPASPINRALAASDELAAAKNKLDTARIEERGQAQADYDQLREELLSEIPDAQRLIAVIEDSTAAAGRMLASKVAIEDRLSPIRKQIERVENQRIEQARKEVAAALNNEEIVALREELNEKIVEYNTKIKSLTAESEEATGLKAQYDEVRAKIQALRTPVE